MTQSTIDRGRIGDRARSHRRLRWIVVLAWLWLPLAVVFSIVWHYYRPLNVAEQRLVGTWRNTTGTGVFTFHSDRTTTTTGFPRGEWYVRGNTLYSPDSFFIEVVQTLFRAKNIDFCELTFEDDDNIAVFTPRNGGTGHWQRVSTKSSSTN